MKIKEFFKRAGKAIGKFLKKAWSAIKDFWQFPQYCLAILMLGFFSSKKKIAEVRDVKYADAYLVRGNFSGISLGRFIILNEKSYQLEKTINHEMGHSRQSLYLGPLYLLIVGLPSITMNILTRWKILKGENYYKRWPENWADKLGSVER